MHAHLTSHIWSTPFAKLHAKLFAAIWPCMCVPLSHFVVQHLDQNVLCMYVCIHWYIYACLPDCECVLTLLQSSAQICVPLADLLCMG